MARVLTRLLPNTVSFAPGAGVMVSAMRVAPIAPEWGVVLAVVLPIWERGGARREVVARRAPSQPAPDGRAGAGRCATRSAPERQPTGYGDACRGSTGRRSRPRTRWWRAPSSAHGSCP